MSGAAPPPIPPPVGGRVSCERLEAAMEQLAEYAEHPDLADLAPEIAAYWEHLTAERGRRIVPETTREAMRAFRRRRTIREAHGASPAS